jgi:hypothetical protein
LILPEGEDREPALAAICSAARAAARELHASFVTFDYLDPGELAGDWQSHGFKPIDISDPGSRLLFQGESFEGFIHSLSKNAQKDYRRHMNQARARNIQVTTHPMVSDPVRALALIHAVEARHGSMPKPWTSDLLEHASETESTWLAASQNGILVGCGLVLRDGPAQVATLLGMDYSVDYVYFPLMYAAIQNAILTGAQELHAGSGAYEFKKHLGFHLENNNHLVYAGCGVVFQRIGAWLGQAISDDKPGLASLPLDG